MIRIGMDFGGTRIQAAALDAEGRFQARVRGPTPPASPDVIVLGGGIETPVRKALHGDPSGARGAAWLWPLDGSP